MYFIFVKRKFLFFTIDLGKTNLSSIFRQVNCSGIKVEIDQIGVVSKSWIKLILFNVLSTVNHSFGFGIKFNVIKILRKTILSKGGFD